MESGELALLPEPLSVSIQKLPSGIFLMPECPCKGWPWNGKNMPVGRPADSPSTVPAASTRLPVVNFPLIFKSSGASWGAAMNDLAGITTWPARLAAKAVGAVVCACTGQAANAMLTASATTVEHEDIFKAEKERDMLANPC